MIAKFFGGRKDAEDMSRAASVQIDHGRLEIERAIADFVEVRNSISQLHSKVRPKGKNQTGENSG